MGRRMDYLAMKTEQLAAANLIDSDINELKIAVMALVHDTTTLGGQSGFGTHFLQWLASFSAIYLLILDRTHWRSNMLTSLLVPYIFLSLPSGPFHLLRGEVGKWIAFVSVVLRLFFHRSFPEWLEMPVCLILLLVVAPEMLAISMKESWMGVVVVLIIGCYLLQEHIRATGGLRNSFTQRHGISNTIGLLLLLAYPIWSLFIYML
ncbi:cold-regulated 413 plasma membrane protein 2-like [Spinacia oleracea]|uniref:Cold-regulated 413 plasma membrane protein 2-like n=1 Tax=Spinacia oleracea TaxID=3562 RepID=A0A9R0IEF8_SPIOL|nr:cold-regulated 413 plasma membrane protein 2-like [Spinacia oleracea]